MNGWMDECIDGQLFLPFILVSQSVGQIKYESQNLLIINKNNNNKIDMNIDSQIDNHEASMKKKIRRLASKRAKPSKLGEKKNEKI